MSAQFQQWLIAALTNLAFCVVSGVFAGLGDYSTVHVGDWHSALIVGILAAASAALTLFGKSYIKMAQTVAAYRSQEVK